MKKVDFLLLLFTISVFLMFQAILVWYVQTTDYDEAVFLDVARNIRRVGLPLRSIGEQGKLYFIHTPLYLYLVTASVSFMGDNPIWTRLVTVLFAIASIILTYLIVRQTQTAVSGFVSAFLLALNTFFSIYAYFLTMAVPMMFFILLAIYWFSENENDPSRRYLIGAGIAAAMAVMLKELALIFVVAAAIYVFIFGQTWKDRIVRLLYVTSPTVLALLLWTWWGVSLSYSQFYAGLMRWLNSASGANNLNDPRIIQSVFWLQILGKNVFSVGLVGLFIVSILAYLLWFRRKLPQLVWLLFLYLGLAIGVSLLVRLKEPRHVIALIPTIALIIGLLVEWEKVWVWLQEKQIRLTIGAFVVFMLAWNISPLKVPSTTTQWRKMETWWEPLFAQRIFQSQRYYGILKDTGEYLEDNTPFNAIITVMHEGPVVGYYADRSHYFLYTMTYPKIMNVLDDTEYLVVDRQSFANLTPEENTEFFFYIEAEFELERLVKDAYREVKIYHRRY